MQRVTAENFDDDVATGGGRISASENQSKLLIIIVIPARTVRILKGAKREAREIEECLDFA